jgi:sulfur dioxygenase
MTGMNAAAPSPDNLQPRPAEGYAGDVTPELAFRWWQAGEAVLVDIRTDAERDWVGFIPGAVNIEWKHWPGMQVRADFDQQMQAQIPAGSKVVMLCRSGIRSVASSRRAAELGYQAYNILEGFQGDPDEQGHRDTRGGWRMRGLPWRQG